MCSWYSVTFIPTDEHINQKPHASTDQALLLKGKAVQKNEQWPHWWADPYLFLHDALKYA